jgi:hypothetical protein
MTTIELLRQAIREQHGLDSEYVEPVRLRAQAPTFELSAKGVEIHHGAIREGTVHVFRVVGHPKAELAYAWSYEADDGEVRHIAVLGVPPIDSADRAYHLAVFAELRRDQTPDADPDWRAVFDDEVAQWKAKSYADLREALSAVIAKNVCCINYAREGPGGSYQVEVQPLENTPDYLHVLVSVCGPTGWGELSTDFIRYAEGRRDA